MNSQYLSHLAARYCVATRGAHEPEKSFLLRVRCEADLDANTRAVEQIDARIQELDQQEKLSQQAAAVPAGV